jgi:uncharacterized protein YgiM (DUF1202 family)
MKKLKHHITLPIILFFSCSLTNIVAPEAENILYPHYQTAKSTQEPLEIDDISSSPAQDVICIVNTSVLNLRDCAGIHCTVQGWLLQGDHLIVLQPGDIWIEVETSGGTTGWINATYCRGE